MKKLTALILTAVMLVCMTAIVPVSADANIIEITAPETSYEVDAGGSVDILWDINEDLAIFNMTFAIDYDESVFTFVEYNEDEEIGSFIWEDMRFKNVSYSYSLTNKNTINALVKSIKAQDVVAGSKYQFLNTLFNVAADAPTGDYEIKFIAADASNYAGENLSVAALPSVTVHVEGVNPPDYDERLTAGAAQLRVPQDEAMAEKFGFGFRFVSEIEQEFAEKDGVVYGVLVAPTKVLEGAELNLDYANTYPDKVANIANTDTGFKTMGVENGKVQFNATMISIKEDKYAADYTFTVVTYATDNGVTTYSKPVTDLTIRSIAQKYVDDTENDYTDYAKEFVTNLVLG